MDEIIGFTLALLILVAPIVAITTGAVYVVGSVSCNAKWGDSGFDHDFGLLSGCLVKDPEGGWIPSENFRQF